MLLAELSGGKSYFGSYWILKSALKYAGTRWLMGRSELKNLKKTTLNSFFEVCKEQGIKAGVHYHYNQQDSIITLINGSQIILADLFSYPSDPQFDSLGSLEITGAFIDEAPQITEKAKNIVKSRIRYKLDEFNLIPKLLMCGNPSKNWVYSEFYKPSKSGELKPDRQFIQALVTDNPHISPHYIESLKGLDKNSRARLLDGNYEYDDDPSALIPYDNIIACFTNSDLAAPKSSVMYITADIARFGSDKTVIGLWYSSHHVELFSYTKQSVSETAAKLKEFATRFNIGMQSIVADEDGVGGGVIDILRCRGFVNNSKPLPNPVTRKDDNFNNLKSQCYYLLADKINSGSLYIECSDIKMKADIIQDLEQVKQYNMDKDGKKQVLPKEKIKELIGRSPDYSDTLMMRELFDLKVNRGWTV